MIAGQKKKVNGALPITILLLCSLLLTLVSIFIPGAFARIIVIDIINILAGALLLLYILRCHGIRNAAWLIPTTAAALTACSIFVYINFLGIIMGLLLSLGMVYSVIFSSCRGLMDKKRFAAVPITGVIMHVILMILCLITGNYNASLEIFVAGNSCALIALFLFGMKNEIPWILRPEIGHMRAKDALGMLNNQRYFGEITEEEYQSKRAQVIQRL